MNRDLFARIQARGERATPALVEKELARSNVRKPLRMRSTRCEPPEARHTTSPSTERTRMELARIINQVRERSGRIDVLLHARESKRSHFLPD